MPFKTHKQMTSTRFPIPARLSCSEIESNRSRFIAAVAPVSCRAAALSVIDERRRLYPDANHHCWAYLIGPPGRSDRTACSDDGEPHGVAGKPLLTTLLHSGLGDLVIVVSRYFGGVKLGKGGMVKAYTRAARAVLDSVPVAEKIAWREITLVCDYPFLEPVKRLLSAYQVQIIAEQFATRVTLRMQVPVDQQQMLEQRLTDICGGQLDWREDACG